jgi:hypothetical protein
MNDQVCLVCDRKFAKLLSGFLIFAAAGVVSKAAESTKSLSVDDPRPVAEAVLNLESLYGWAITYEDPRYVHPGELSDVTARARRDLHAFPVGKAPKVIIPRGGTLSFNYPVNASSGVPDDPAGVMQRLIESGAAADGSTFRLLQSGGYFHVVPAQVKDENGVLQEQASILDTVISVSQDGDGREMLEAICNALGIVAGTKVVVGSIPEKLFHQEAAGPGVFNQAARDILTKTLAGTGVALSWRLLYDPGLKEYVLNIHPIPSR